MTNSKLVILAALNELRRQWNLQFVEAQYAKNKKLQTEVLKNMKKLDDLIKTLEKQNEK